jgi:hypothetical protein
MENFNNWHPAVQITTIVCAAAVIIVFFWQFWKTIRGD